MSIYNVVDHVNLQFVNLGNAPENILRFNFENNILFSNKKVSPFTFITIVTAGVGF